MATLRGISGGQARRAFERIGWKLRNTTKAKGSHIWIMKKEGNPNLLSIQNKNDIGPGLLKKWIRAAGVTNDEFLQLLDQ